MKTITMYDGPECSDSIELVAPSVRQRKEEGITCLSCESLTPDTETWVDLWATPAGLLELYKAIGKRLEELRAAGLLEKESE